MRIISSLALNGYFDESILYIVRKHWVINDTTDININPQMRAARRLFITLNVLTVQTRLIFDTLFASNWRVTFVIHPKTSYND